jgi:hypothetical protein
MTKLRVYKVIFASQGKLFEIYARRVSSSEINGFVEVEELLFGEKTTLLVDPSEEQLKQEFSGVCKTHIPFHTVVRIDEVDRQGKGRILQLATPGEGGAGIPSSVIRPGTSPDKA